MILRGTIPEIISHYDPKEKKSWVRTFGHRRNFPNSPRFGHCSFNQPKYFFGETVYVRELMKRGYECWQERYQLLKPIKPGSRYTPFNQEIMSRMGKKKFKRLNSVRQFVSYKPREPDIIAWHPKKRKFEFYEIKMPGDSVRKSQIHGLALLRHICKAKVAVVRLIPNGKATPSQAYEYEYCFEFKET